MGGGGGGANPTRAKKLGLIYLFLFVENSSLNRFEMQAKLTGTSLIPRSSKYNYLEVLKGAQAWPSRVRIFLHKSDPYG